MSGTKKIGYDRYKSLATQGRQLHLTFLSVSSFQVVAALSMTDVDIFLGKAIQLPIFKTSVPMEIFFGLVPLILFPIGFYFFVHLDSVKRVQKMFDAEDKLKVYPWEMTDRMILLEAEPVANRNWLTKEWRHLKRLTRIFTGEFFLWNFLPLSLLLTALLMMRVHHLQLGIYYVFMISIATLVAMYFKWKYYDFTFKKKLRFGLLNWIVQKARLLFRRNDQEEVESDEEDEQEVEEGEAETGSLELTVLISNQGGNTLSVTARRSAEIRVENGGNSGMVATTSLDELEELVADLGLADGTEESAPSVDSRGKLERFLSAIYLLIVRNKFLFLILLVNFSLLMKICGFGPEKVQKFYLFNLDLKNEMPGTELKNTRSNVFSNRDLSYGNYDNSVFDGLILDGADFRGASLNDASFVGASLVGCIFDHTVMNSADFSGADMTGASFRNALLKETKYDSTDLQGAVFDGARLEYSDFELSKNLEHENITKAEILTGAELPHHLKGIKDEPIFVHLFRSPPYEPN